MLKLNKNGFGEICSSKLYTGNSHPHSNPDGDAIGSQVGFMQLIRHNFPHKTVYIVGDDPKRYGFVEESQPQTVPDETYANALAVILDTSVKTMISDNRYERASAT